MAAVSHPGRALHPEHALPSATRNWQPPGEGVFAVLAEAADPSMSLDEMEVVHAPEASALPLTSLVPRDEATFCYEDYVDKYEKTEEEAQEVTAGTTSGHSWWQNWGEWEDGGDILAESSTWTSWTSWTSWTTCSPSASSSSASSSWVSSTWTSWTTCSSSSSASQASSSRSSSLPASSQCLGSSSCSSSSTLLTYQSGNAAAGPSDLPPIPEDDQHGDVAEEGWVRRWGSWRTGRDRWHNSDGTLRSPRRLSRPSVSEEEWRWPVVGRWDPNNPWPSLWEEDKFAGQANNAEGADVEPEHPLERPGLPSDQPAQLSNEEDLPADDWDQSHETGDRQREAVVADEADEAGGTGVGFWHHGRWVPRERTAEELRCHRGGQGTIRQSRRDARRDEWLQGLWRPAWLRQYQADKARRDRAREGANSEANSTGASPVTCTSTSTTTTVADNWSEGRTDGDLESETDLSHFMQLTGAERARLQEAGLGSAQLDRLESLLEHVHEQQDGGQGPEFRWSLRCFLRRLAAVMELLEAVQPVLERRLLCQGYWPVTRVPARLAQQHRLFQWGRQFSQTVLDAVEDCLADPMSADDTGHAPQADELHEGITSIATSVEPRSRSRSRSCHTSPSKRCSSRASRSSRRRRTSSRRRRTSSSSASSKPGTSELAWHSDGEWREVHPNTEPGPHGPPIPTPVNMPPPQATVTTAALEQFVATLDAPIDPADLRGIWSEPDNSGAESSSTSTTSTSHAWTSSSVAPSLPRSSSSGGMKEEQEDVVALVQTMGPSGSRRREDDSSSPRRRGRLTNLQRRGELQAEGEERVRRVVDEQLQHAVRADHRDFVRRLLDRMRGLRSRLHLYGVAVEQALTWWPRDEGDQPWNAALLEELVVREIVNVGTGMSSSSSSMAGGYSVLLQPGLPQGAAIDNQLPGVPRSVIAGLRRRVWQSHMANVEPFPPLDAPNPGRWRDAPLFFVPAASEVVPNLPPGCLPPEDPLTKRVREGVANRRRLQRLPRRRPVQEPHDYHVARARPARVTPLEPERDPPPEPAHVEVASTWSSGLGRRDRSRSRDHTVGYPRRRLPGRWVRRRRVTTTE